MGDEISTVGFDGLEKLVSDRARLRASLEAITKAAKAMGMNEKAYLILFEAEKTLEEVK